MSSRSSSAARVSDRRARAWTAALEPSESDERHGHRACATRRAHSRNAAVGAHAVQNTTSVSDETWLSVYVTG